MNPTTTAMLHVRIDEGLKSRAGKALNAMGLSVSDAVRILMVRVAEEKRMPFEIRVPNAKTVAAMREAETKKLPSFSSVKELMADLNEAD
jgi:DNA-damage-inducible protein J